MKDYNLYWMNYSIDIANDVDSSRLRVGAVLISTKNELFGLLVKIQDYHGVKNCCLKLISII